MNRHWILRGLKFALFGALLVAAFTLVLMALWNWLAPAVFGWKAIDFWQALGLLVLSRILFGFRMGFGYRGHWRGRMAERWERMSPEEREKFREGMRGRCGHHRRDDASPTQPATSGS